MGSKFFITIALFIISNSLLGQTPFDLTKTEAQGDFRILKNALEYVHPRLYKYTDKDLLLARFDSLYNAIDGNISGLDFLSIVSKANASVNCGHLYTIPQGELRTEVLNKKVLPFYFKVIDSEIYIRHNCSGKGDITRGSKIVSINNIKAAEILKIMFGGIATDGYIDTRKRRLAERYFFYEFQGFDLYYHLHVDRSTSFEIEYMTPESGDLKLVKVQGITLEERSHVLRDLFGLDEDSWFRDPSPKFHLSEKEDYGVLTISRSFYNEDIDPEYDSILAESFKTLEKKSILNLIIDLRNNEGGSEHQQMELISYLYHKPFKLYQNTYLSQMDFSPLKDVIIERDTSDLIFNNDDEYMRRFSNNLWINNYEYSDNLRLQKPKKNVFKGQIYVLINGITFSSAADMAANIRKTTDAIFIGEETGGAYEGPTGGSAIVVQLPNSKIMVRISPNIHLGYMYKKHPIGRGVLPEHQIKYSIQDILSKNDLEMETAIKLIGDSN